MMNHWLTDEENRMPPSASHQVGVGCVVLIDGESEEDLKNAKCNSKYNSIKKAFSNFIGRPYKPPSIYNKTMKNNKKENNVFNKTRRTFPPPAISTMGGNKTRKIKY